MGRDATEGGGLAACGLRRYDPAMNQPAPDAARAPIIESVLEGFTFVARDWRAILPVALIAAVTVGAMSVWLQMLQAQQNVVMQMAVTVLSAIVQAVFLAALLRRALSQGQAPLALAAGRDEANLMGVTLSLGFLYMIVFIFGLLVIMMSLGALLAGSNLNADALKSLPPEEAGKQFLAALGSDGTLVLLVLGTAFLALVLWISARLILSYPATVAEGRMFVFSTWNWTKSNGLRLMACLLLVSVGGLLLSMLAVAPFTVIVEMVFGKGAQLVAGAPAQWVIAILTAFFSTMFSLAPYAGLTAYLYRGLRSQNA